MDRTPPFVRTEQGPRGHSSPEAILPLEQEQNLKKLRPSKGGNVDDATKSEPKRDLGLGNLDLLGTLRRVH